MELEPPSSRNSPSESSSKKKSCTSMIEMNTQNWRVSHLEWIISEARKNREGSPSMNGSISSGTMQLIFIGMRFGWIAHATTKRNMSALLLEVRAMSKTRQDDPRIL
jgi:hypothetical protein